MKITKNQFKTIIAEPNKLQLIFELIEYVLAFIEKKKFNPDVKLKWWDFLLSKDLREFTLFVILRVIAIVKF